MHKYGKEPCRVALQPPSQDTPGQSAPRRGSETTTARPSILKKSKNQHAVFRPAMLCMCGTRLLNHAGFLQLLLKWYGHCHTGLKHLTAGNCGDTRTECGAGIWILSLLSNHRPATPLGRMTYTPTQAEQPPIYSSRHVRWPVYLKDFV